MSSRIHRILTLGGAVHRYDSVGHCIYCNRSPPAVSLTDEHIIPDGLGGDLLLLDASCRKCATITGRSEQLVLREMLRLPRGALGVRSRKKRAKQTGFRILIDSDDDVPLERDIPFTAGMSADLNLFITKPPGILRAGSVDDECVGWAYITATPNFVKYIDEIFGPDYGEIRTRVHPGIFGQMVAKIAHAFAIAEVGSGQFTPFLTDYILSRDPPFDGYHMGALPNHNASDAIVELQLDRTFAPVFTVGGVLWRRVYIVNILIFGVMCGPDFRVVVGEPV